MKNIHLEISDSAEEFLLDWINELNLVDPVIQILWGRVNFGDYCWSVGINYKKNMGDFYVDNCIYHCGKYEIFITQEKHAKILDKMKLDFVNGNFVFSNNEDAESEKI